MKLWEAARSFLGVPWLDGGRSSQGVDCYGLVILSLRKIGINADPNDRLGRNSSLLELHKAMHKLAPLVKPASASLQPRQRRHGIQLNRPKLSDEPQGRSGT